MKENFTMFWSGPFSQWHPSTFVIDGVTYNCAEQYMMAEKARLFGDKSAEAKIMSTSDPDSQKRWGREVRGFDVDKWNAVAQDIVYRASKAKFTQNDDLKATLVATVGTTLVEASPYDTIWGIGLRKEDPRAMDRATWRGTNWLGIALTRVRNEILANAV
jgi:ribA/ribD-fused uncharacterized protein